jgi:hypothetical protein
VNERRRSPDDIKNVVQIERQDWDEYWDKLVKANLVVPADRIEFDRDFTHTDRNTATPRPGIHCMFVWSLDAAERLDTRGQLEQAVRDRINQLLEALGEDRLEGAG